MTYTILDRQISQLVEKIRDEGKASATLHLIPRWKPRDDKSGDGIIAMYLDDQRIGDDKPLFEYRAAADTLDEFRRERRSMTEELMQAFNERGYLCGQDGEKMMQIKLRPGESIENKLARQEPYAHATKLFFALRMEKKAPEVVRVGVENDYEDDSESISTTEVVMAFSDQYTGAIEWKLNKYLFEYLRKNQIPTHYVRSPQERFTIVERIWRKIPLEVFAYRIATPEYCRRHPEATEGTVFAEPVVECIGKIVEGNAIHEEGPQSKIPATKSERAAAEQHAKQVLYILESGFRRQGYQPLCVKIEEVIVQNQKKTSSTQKVGDKLTGRSLTLLPIKSGSTHNNPLTMANAYDVLDSSHFLGRDLYGLVSVTPQLVAERDSELLKIVRRL